MSYPQPWGPPQGWPPQPPPKPPQSNTVTALAAVGAIVVTCAVCSVFGRSGARGADAGVSAPSSQSMPAVPPGAPGPSPDDGVEDEAAAAEVRRSYRSFCIPGRRRRDPGECPDWYRLITGIDVTRAASGRYRARVRTLIPQRDALGQRLATTICVNTMTGLPGGAAQNIEGTVQVLMLDGNIIAHNNFGQCTTGLF